MTERTGGELIQDFLATYKIPFVFGNPGTTETTFLAAIAASKATYVLSLHGSSAVPATLRANPPRSYAA